MARLIPLHLARLAPARADAKSYHPSLEDFNPEKAKEMLAAPTCSEWAAKRLGVFLDLMNGATTAYVCEKHELKPIDVTRLRRDIWRRGLEAVSGTGRGQPPNYVPEEVINRVVRLYLWGVTIPREDWTGNLVIRAIRAMCGVTIGPLRAQKILQFCKELGATTEIPQETLIEYFGGPFTDMPERSVDDLKKERLRKARYLKRKHQWQRNREEKENEERILQQEAARAEQEKRKRWKENQSKAQREQIARKKAQEQEP